MGKNDQESAEALLVQVAERRAKKEEPLLVSDGDWSIPPAMRAVWGKEVEEGTHRGPRWKKPRRAPNEEVLFARAIKQPDGKGRLVNIVEEVTWGDPEEV
ncbi:MAG: hypothetical protein HYW07_16075 [Candidatus Latescibacteria bacterium]|nr:hypothetical protein [Candidatus Latescibacterota bacterium]